MLFSMLANLAEDRQGGATEPGRQSRRGRRHSRAGEGIGADKVADLLDHALIMPVLTAHPTEVRRKSMIDHRNRIADLMRMRDAGASETPDGEPVEEAIARQIALLWLTRPLRRERLFVADEIEIALVLSARHLPSGPAAALRGWERAARPPSAELPARSAAGSAAIATAIPNVTAETLRLALGRSARSGARSTISTRSTPSAPSSRSRRELAAGRARTARRLPSVGARSFAGPRRRTLPPGDQRHLCAAGRHLRGDHRARAAAPVEPGRRPYAGPDAFARRPRGHRRLRSARTERGLSAARGR